MKQGFSKKLSLCIVAACLLLTAWWNPVSPAMHGLSSSSSSLVRLGLLGDSLNDEYQGTDDRGGDYRRVTLNWLEQLVKGERVYAGEWGGWDEPRRAGYEYNWSRSGATAKDLIESGQHTGLAVQVANGEIDVVFIHIGSNDFAPYREDYSAIYSGSLAGDALQEKTDGVIANIVDAVDTLQASGEVPILLATVPDWSLMLSLTGDARFRDLNGVQRVSDAISAVNAGLATLAESRDDVTLIDQGLFGARFLRMALDGKFRLGNEVVNLLTQGDEPHNGLLSDGIHPGTVLEGHIANIYLGFISQVVGLDIPPLSDEEIMANAGLR